MKKNWNEYFSKLKQWMFPDEEKYEPATENKKRMIHIPHKQVINKEEYDVKMIHQYPKKGTFRFPLIEDESPEPPALKQNKDSGPEPDVSEFTRKKEQKEQKEQKGAQDERQPKKKFQGEHFKPQMIPSPVYGFHPREEKRNSKKEKREEDKNEEAAGSADTEETLIQETEMTREPAKPSVQEKEVAVQRETEPADSEDFSYGLSDITFVSEEDYTPNEKGISKIQGHQGSERSEGGAHEEEETSADSSAPEKELAGLLHKKRSSRGDGLIENSHKPDLSETSATAENAAISEGSHHFNQGNSYAFPPLSLLDLPAEKSLEDDRWLEEKTQQLNETFEYFRIRAKVVEVTKGPSVTRFEVQPDPGVKVSKIVNLSDDIKLSLAAREIRIEAPIPGKNAIGIEVPNEVAEPVHLSEILRDAAFQKQTSPLSAAMGMGISGEAIVTDLQKMPHGLIAGATGSGKSVCVNSILTSILYKAAPDEVRLLLIDPKMVELAPYNEVPHLAAPVITDPKEATKSLKWAVSEMENRYEKFAKAGARDISRYNEKMKKSGNEKFVLPYLLIVVDELADLMMVSPQEVEDSICRIAQKARACGIHLLVATQRPSVDVITGLIKANIPTRVAFSVSSQVDSRTILDGSGAEKLLGRGDMLMLENGSSKPLRVQGTFVSDDEIERVVDYVSKSPAPGKLFQIDELKEQTPMETEDPLFDEVCEFVAEQQAASASLIQRRFRMGYNRAARLIDDMEARGLVSPQRGSKPREVYLTNHDYKEENI
ncbi:DNA translocase FtsK [Salipaludibacillus aurantiacus]|uniref:DNA segregation ATPase FtsK/SpoIIIE, S-DNA-T family n=1 Tax=Salipaludibacillus aurantiacus TaxID=1601833 RepID=A0A1H9WN93_9BACI|nr:DNA translocase FtsK [Salipaludibacillus aurantiacus]SES35157.1 DNA segregation ATPase FtsK/SpoIIIE, S-DNA-T family [Salipaludibacillus aurantiacus]